MVDKNNNKIEGLDLKPKTFPKRLEETGAILLSQIISKHYSILIYDCGCRVIRLYDEKGLLERRELSRCEKHIHLPQTITM